MKALAVFLTVLVLISAGCLYYGLSNAHLEVVGKGLQVLPAQERSAQFEALRDAIAKQTMQGTLLNNSPLSDASDYTYYIYSLRLKNPGLVSAEMVELQIAPTDADILFYGDTEEMVIPAGQSRDVWCVLLTKGTPLPIREIYITYYIWGHPMEMRYTYDETR